IPNSPIWSPIYYIQIALPRYAGRRVAWEGQMARFRAGCDIGGTFTDFVLLDQDSGDIHVAKRLTTPDDPSIAMLAGFAGFEREAPGYPVNTARLAHATTLVANAVIERKGARTALLCTAGFRDVLELRRYV